MVTSESQVIQVTNLAPQATRDQMQTLFNFFGKIDDLRLYPTNRDISSNPVLSRICFIKFHDSDSISGALHLTNTVFIDRALIVVVAAKNDIPEEAEAMSILQKEVLFPLTQSLPELSDSEKGTEDQNGQEEGENGKKVGAIKRNKLPPYPQLLASYDIRKIEIIRRTILVYDYDPEIVSPKELIEYFCTVAEVKQMRMCHKANDPNKLYALIEFSEQSGIVAAFKLNGSLLNGFKIRLMHSTQAIVAPITKPTDLPQTELEETMKRLKEAQNLIANAIDPFGSILSGSTVVAAGSKDEEKIRSRSRTRSKSRGRSRVRSKSKLKSKSRSKSRKKSVASRSRSKSRSRRRKSRSRSRHSRRRRSRSSRRRHDRSESRSRARRVRSSRSRSRSKTRKRSRSHSHRRSHRRHHSPTPEKSSSSSSISRHKTKSSTTSKRSRSRSRSKTRSGSHSKDEKKSHHHHHHRHSKSSRRSKSRSRSHTKSRHKSDSKHKSSRKTSPKLPKSPSPLHSSGDKPEIKNETESMEVDSNNETNGNTNGTAEADVEMKSVT